MRLRSLFFAFLAVLATAASAQVVAGRVDDFQDGTTQSWSGGANPANIPNGGPVGAGDKYLEISSDGTHHLASYNITRWTGNYSTVGIAKIEADLKCTGATQLVIRLVLFGLNSDRWSSNTPIVVSPGDPWVHVSFDISAANFTHTQGAGTFNDTYTNLDRIMFRHEPVISSGGVNVTGALGIDNVVGKVANGFTFALNKSQVAGQNSVKGTITPDTVKPTNTVFTTFDDSSLVTTPATVTVAANAAFKDFQITVTAVNSTINTTISAKLGTVTKTAPLALIPLVPTAMAFTPNPVVGGNTLSCRLIINGVAGPGGRVVSVFDNSPNTTMPSQVTVPAGATQVIFDIQTTPVTTPKNVTLTAAVSAGTKTGTFRINP
jgi:hypothetical protein